MGRNSWILVALLASLLVVVVYRFEEYQVAGDYLIYTTASCDATNERCFVMDCDPTDEECDQTPYKKITVHAGSAPACALEHTCEDFVCPVEDSSCEVLLCNDDAVEDGEVCMDIEIPEESLPVDAPLTDEVFEQKVNEDQ